MPSEDLLIQPEFGTDAGRPILVVVPGSLVDTYGEAVVQQRVDNLLVVIENIAAGDTKEYGYDTSVNLVQRVQSILARRSPADVRPDTVNELLRPLGDLHLDRGDIPLPQEVSLVVYLDPETDQIPVSSGVYRSRELAGTGQTGVGFIAFNGNDPIGVNNEVTPSFVGALYQVSEAVQGRYSRRTRQEAEEYSRKVAEFADFPRLGADRPRVSEFIRTDRMDRVGFELEVDGIRLGSRAGNSLSRGTVLAQTPDRELGEPVFKLVLDQLRLPEQLGIVPKRFFYPELVVGPLTTEEYSSPNFHLARRLFLRQFQTLTSQQSIGTLIEQYNQALWETLGGAWERYALDPREEAGLENIVVSPRSSVPVAYSNQATVTIPYARLGSPPFIESLHNPALMGGMGRLSTAVDGLLKSLRIPKTLVTPELEAFVFQLFFDELQRDVAGGEGASKLSYKLLLRFSLEDVIFSVLNDDQIEFLGKWFEKPSSRIHLQTQFSKMGLDAGEGSAIWKRMVNVFSTTLSQRREVGRAQLLVDVFDTTTYSPVPDDSGRLVHHSHPFAESRRPFLVKDGRFYATVEYRSALNPLVALVEDMDGWINGTAVDGLRRLLDGAYVPDAYARAASSFITKANELVASSTNEGAAWEAGLQRILDTLPRTVPALDDHGRISQANESWWREVYRITGKLEERIAETGNTRAAMELAQGVRQGLGVNVDAPIHPLGDVRFSQGRFFTWRGEVFLSELGLPENWRPGDALAGFSAKERSLGVTHYRFSGARSALPREFIMTWNGLAWPVDALKDLPAEDTLDWETVEIKDSSSQDAPDDVLEIPQGGRRLGPAGGHIWGYELPELDGVLVLLDLEAFGTGGAAPERLKDSWLRFQKVLTVLKRTKTGGSILDGLGQLPLRSAEELEGVGINGVTASELVGDRPIRMVLRLTGTMGEVGALTSQTGRSLPVYTENLTQYGDGLNNMILDFSRRLAGIVQAMAPLDVLPGENPSLARGLDKLAVENQLALELGTPLRARYVSWQTDMAYPLDGSIPFVDENSRPISPERLRISTMINRQIHAFMALGETLDPDIRTWPVDSEHPSEDLHDMFAHLQGLAESTEEDRETLRTLAALKRHIQEMGYRMGLQKEAETLENLRQPASGPLESTDRLLVEARENYEAWDRWKNQVLDDGELTSQAREFIDREISGVGEGYRDPTDFAPWLEETSTAIRDYTLSRLIEGQREDPDNSYISSLLSEQDDAVDDALQRGGLSFGAQQYLAEEVERRQMGVLLDWDGRASDRLILGSGLRKAFLENRAKPVAFQEVNLRFGQSQRRNQGYYRNEFHEINRDNDSRLELAQTVKVWRSRIGEPRARALYKWLYQSLHQGGSVDANGDPVRSFVSVVREPLEGRVVAMAAGHVDGDGDISIEGIFADPDLTSNGAKVRWTGAQADALVVFVRRISQAFSDSDIVLDTSDRHIYRMGLDHYFVPENQDEENQETQVSAEAAAESLHSQRLRVVKELAHRLNNLLEEAREEGLPTPLENADFALERLINKYQRQAEESQPDLVEVGRKYYALRQAMAEFAEQLGTYSQTRPDLPWTGMEAFRDYLARTAPHPDDVSLGIRYADAGGRRLIIQLGDDPASEAAAGALLRKNPEDTEWAQLGDDGQLRTVSGRTMELDLSSKVILVGRGSVGAISGLSAQEIVSLLIGERVFYHVSEIRRIALVASSTDDPATPETEGAPGAGFARELMAGLENSGVLVGSVSSRTALVMVDDQGRKWTGIPDERGRITWSQKNSAHKLIVQRNADGDFVMDDVPVAQGLVRVISGDRTRALGELRNGVFRFENGVQVTEDGRTPASENTLSPSELSLVRALLGDSPQGLVRFEQGRVISAPIELSSVPVVPEDSDIVSILSAYAPGQSQERPQLSQALEHQVDGVVGEMRDGHLSAQDFRNNFHWLTTTQRRVLVSKLLTAYGDNPDSQNLGRAIQAVEPALVEDFKEGRLSAQARRVATVLWEENRLARLQALGAIPVGPENGIELHLEPVGAAALLESTPGRGDRRMGVDTNGLDVDHPVDNTAFTHRVYAFNSAAEALDRRENSLGAELMETLEELAGQFRETAQESGSRSPAYAVLNQIFYDQGRLDNHGALLPTWLVVTRDPSGRVAALGIFSHDGDQVGLDLTVSAADLGAPLPGGVQYRVGADFENRLAALRHIHQHFPEERILVTATDSTTLENSLELGFVTANHEGGQLIPQGDGPSFLRTFASLVERKMTLVSTALDQLRQYADSGALAPEDRTDLELWENRSRDLSREFGEPVDLARQSELDAAVDGLRTRVARTAQRIRLFRNTPGDWGNTLAFVEEGWRPAEDSLVKSYLDMVKRVGDETVGRYLARADGTPRDYARLFLELGWRSPNLLVRAMEGVLEQARQGELPIAVADAVAQGLGSLESGQRDLVNGLLARLGRENIEALSQSQSLASRSGWDLMLSSHLKTYETLRQSGEDAGGGANGTEPTAQGPEAGRLVRFNRGEVVDAFGLPVLAGSGGDLTPEEADRVHNQLGDTFTGRIRLLPNDIIVEPVGDLLTLNPELGFVTRLTDNNQTHVLADVLPRVPDTPVGRLRDLSLARELPGGPEEENHPPGQLPGDLPDIASPPPESDTAVRITAMDQELVRLRQVQARAVQERIHAYQANENTSVIVDEATLVREGDLIRFSVVEEQRLTPQGGIPETAPRIDLETRVEGLGNDYLDLFQRMTHLATQDTEAPSRAWATLVGSGRESSAVAYSPEQGSQPTTPAVADPVSLAKAKESVLGRLFLRRGMATLDKLRQTHGITPDWVPILETMTVEDGVYRIQFVDRLDPSRTRVIETQDGGLMRLRSYMDAHLTGEQAALRGIETNQNVEGDSLDFLNNAFMVQFIVGLAQDFQRQEAGAGSGGTLATALEVHRWLFGAQVAYGAALDTIKIYRLVKTLLKSGDAAISAASKTAHALTYVGEGIGAAFMAANVVLDSIQLAKADNPVQEAVFGTQLAFDSTGLVLSGAGIGVSITADVATAIGATAAVTVAGTVGALLGGAGVIVAGLGIGVAALAQNYSVIAEKAKSVGKFFKSIDDGFKGNGFKYDTSGDTPLLSALGGAVVTQVDFRSNQVTFGNHYISQTTHGSTGSGKINYFLNSGDFPKENTHAQLNIRTELGYGDRVALEHGETPLVVLPATPEIHMSGLDWQTLPGATTKNEPGYDVLRRLEDNYLFDYDFYVFPSEYILQEIKNISYTTTAVDVRLDSRDRTLAMPDIPQEQKWHVHYQIYGQGGQYTLALNEGTWVDLHNQGDTPSTWIFDAANLDHDDIRFNGDQLRVGNYVINGLNEATGDHFFINHARDMYTVDASSRSISLLSVNAQGHGDGLMAFLAGRTIPGRFLQLTNYQVNNRTIGSAWYDKETREIRYVDVDSADMTAHLQLLDMMGNQMILLAEKEGKIEIWKVDAATHRVGDRYGLVSSGRGGTHRLSGIWNDGNQLILEQTQTLDGNSIVRRYRLSDEGLALSMVRGDQALTQWFTTGRPLEQGWWNRLVPNTVVPTTWDRDGTQSSLSYTGRFFRPRVDAWIAVMDDNRRAWIHRDTAAVVVAGMAEIPDDLQIVGLDDGQEPNVALLYSASQQTVYRQEGRLLSPDELGTEAVSNGGFDTADSWQLTGDTRVAQGRARVAGGGLSQALTHLHGGTHYTIRFDTGGGNRADLGSAVLKVLWNGAQVGMIDWEAGMEAREIQVVADDGANVLGFEVVAENQPPGFFIDNVSIKARPVIEYDQVRSLFTQGPHPIFETLTGELHRLEGTGDTQLVGVTQTWLLAHPDRDETAPPDPDFLEEHTHTPETAPETLPTPAETTVHRTWRSDLRDLAGQKGVDSEPVLAVQGLTDADGNSLAGWYDVKADKFIVTATPEGGSLIYLGLTRDGDQALVYDRDNGRLYHAGLLDETALANGFGNDHVLEPGAVLPGLLDVFAGFYVQLENVVPHDDDQYLAVTTGGRVFLVGATIHPSLVAVQDNWQGTEGDLTGMIADFHHEEVVRVLQTGRGDVPLQNWYLSQTGQWANFSGRSWDDMEWVGLSLDHDLAYFFDKSSQEVVSTVLSNAPSFSSSLPPARVVSSAGTVQRFLGGDDGPDTLVVGSARYLTQVTPPVVDGISALVLMGAQGADRFHITREIWSHYTTIVVDAGQDGEVVDTVYFDQGIDFADLVTSRDSEGGLVLWDSRTHRRIVFRDVFSSDDQTRALHGNIQVQFAGTAPISLETLGRSVQAGDQADAISEPSEIIRGGEGNDTITGHDGDDLLFGEDGDDEIIAQGGDDVLVGGMGGDTLSGGPGEDTLLFSGATGSNQGVTVDLAAGTGRGADAQGDSYHGIENVVGTAHDDRIYGDDGANRLEGGDGDDVLSGRGGDDILVSRSGNDRLSGGDGRDRFVIKGIDPGGQRRIRVTNGGRDGKTDTLFLDLDHSSLSHSRIVGDRLEIIARGLVLELGAWQYTGDTPVFEITTRDGFTYEVNRQGDLRVTAVDMTAWNGGADLDLTTGLDRDRQRRTEIYAQYGNAVFPIPHSPSGAGVVKADDRANDLTGDGADTVFYAGGSGQGIDRLRGGLGQDTYVLESTGRYRIDNIAGDGAVDQVVLKTAFNGIQALRDGNTLQLTASTQVASLVIEVVDYFSREAARHLVFKTSDGVWFTIAQEDLAVADRAVVLKTIVGLDLSLSESDIAIDLERLEGYELARYAVTSLVGALSHRNRISAGALDSRISGGGSNDEIQGNVGKDIVDAGVGNDHVTGNGGDDTLFGGDGHDEIYGNQGNDILVGGYGEDLLDGGEGEDTLRFQGDRDNRTGVTVDLSAGRGLGADAQGDIYTNIEHVLGTAWEDVVTGNEKDNVLAGRGGDDQLIGNQGDDLLLPGRGRDRVDGGQGNDTVQYTGLDRAVRVNLEENRALILDPEGRESQEEQVLLNIENVQGTDHADILVGDAGDNRFLGSLGQDRVDGGEGYDVLDYSALTLPGSRGIYLDLAQWGDDGEDRPGLRVFARNIEAVLGTGGDDRIHGSSQDEVLDGRGGLDLIQGRGGNDTLFGRADGDTLDGGEGRDTLDYSLVAEGINASLATGRGGALDRIVMVENLHGSLFDDQLEGDDQDNVLFGNLGLDVIHALAGDDTFIGTGDGDIFHGGAGEDRADFSALGAGAFVTMGTREFTELERDKWENQARRSDHLISVETVVGSEFDDYIQVSGAANEVIRSQGGDDWLMGSAPAPTFEWDSTGNAVPLPSLPQGDVLDGGEGFDLVSYANARAGVYADLASGRAGGDRLISIEGLEGSAFSDVLKGGSGDDLFHASFGEDFVLGGRGRDVLDFSRISPESGVVVQAQDPDYTLHTQTVDGDNGPGVQLTLDLPRGGFRAGDELALTLNGIRVSLVLQEADPAAEMVRDALIRAIQDQPEAAAGMEVQPGEEGTVIRLYSQDGSLPVVAVDNSNQGGYLTRIIDPDHWSQTRTRGVEAIVGSRGDDRFEGSRSRDEFFGAAGDDRLTGNLGNDLLDGGLGDDTYLYNRGDGNDRIRDAGGSDALEISGIGPSEIAFWRQGNDLIMGIGDEWITVENGLTPDGAVEHIALSDGHRISATGVAQLISAMSDFAAQNQISIESVDDVAASPQLMHLAAAAWQMDS